MKHTLPATADPITQIGLPQAHLTPPKVSEHTSVFISIIKLHLRHGLLHIVLPFSEREREFLDRLIDCGEIKTLLLTNDLVFVRRIKKHPAL